MVNEDSDLVRAHPDWVLRGRARRCRPRGGTSRCSTSRYPRRLRARARRAAARCSTEYDIAFLKWDHNRDLIDVAHDGPAGGARADAGVLPAARRAARGASRPGDRDLRQRRRPDRPRGADPHRPGLAERHHRRGRAAADPALDLAAGAARDARRPPRRAGRAHHRPHATSSTSAPPPPCSATSASSGTCAGSTRRTRAQVAAWVALHKRIRPVLSAGRLVRGDHPDPALVVTGVVAADAGEAWYVVATVDTPLTQSPAAVLLPGLDPARTYRVTRENPPADRHVVADLGSTWLDGDGDRGVRQRARRGRGPAPGAGARERARAAGDGRRLTASCSSSATTGSGTSGSSTTRRPRTRRTTCSS